jgi:hypothetical protein
MGNKKMTFNINSFRSEIQQNGYLKYHDYNLIITAPNILTSKTIFSTSGSSSTSNMQALMSMRINEARSPLITLVSADVNRYSIGPTQKQPHNAQFSDMFISLYCDRNGTIWNFWHTWLNTIFNFSPPYNTAGGTINNGFASYTTEYKDNYSTNMQLNIYDQVAQTILSFVFEKAFPIQMRDVALNWAHTQDIVQLNIDITYKDYAIIGSGVQAVSTSATVGTTALPPAVSIPTLTTI